jgi:Na+/H+ antiporter NhaD/arsenite permease-like protein
MVECLNGSYHGFDATTTMLWIGGQITTVNIMRSIFLPGLLSMMVLLATISLMMHGRFDRNTRTSGFIKPPHNRPVEA